MRRNSSQSSRPLFGNSFNVYHRVRGCAAAVLLLLLALRRESAVHAARHALTRKRTRRARSHAIDTLAKRRV
jgi:hypothetical protein